MHTESTAFSITTNGDGEMRRREKEGPLENPTSFTLRSATHFVGYSNKVLVHEKRRQHNRSLREQFFEVPLRAGNTCNGRQIDAVAISKQPKSWAVLMAMKMNGWLLLICCRACLDSSL